MCTLRDSVCACIADSRLYACSGGVSIEFGAVRCLDVGASEYWNWEAR